MVIDLSPFYTLPNSLEKLFESYWSPFPISQRRLAYPPLNLSEDKDNIYVRAEMPGMTEEDVEVTMTDSSLVIKGERKIVKGKYYRQERPAGAFQRIVNVNAVVDKGAIKARMKDGLLTITLPKAEENKPRTIAIATE